MNADAIMIKEQDNVATALRDIQANEQVVIRAGCSSQEMVVREYIPFGHKFAIKNISRGERIVKYGEVMGQATQDIPAGTHAHIQNIESLRGRGDLVTPGS